MEPWVILFTFFILLLTPVLMILGTPVMRRQKRVRFSLRRIGAYRKIPVVVAEAVESERPIHVSFGSSGLGTETTISALAVSDLLYPLAERAAITNEPPIISVSDPTALPLAQGTLRRAYAVRQNMAAYRSSAVRWYPQGPRSLAFAAGVGSAIAEEDANLSVVVGRFGPEIAFMGEAATRYDQMFFGQSDQLDGQAVAWVMSDSPLIGEELYVAGAYLGRQSATHMSQLLTMEILRLLVIVAILVLALLSIAVELLILAGAIMAVVAVLLGIVFLIRNLQQRRRA